MPKEEHRKIVKLAHKRGIFKEKNPDRFDAYVYGTLNKIEKRRKSKKRRSPKSKQSAPERKRSTRRR